MSRIFFLIALLLVFGGAFLNAQADWELKRDKDGIRIYTRDIEGSSFKAFKAETTVSGDMDALLDVLTDVEHFTDWMPSAQESKMLEGTGPQSKTYYVVSAAPWPVSDRDGVYKYQIKRGRDEGSLTIFIEAVPDYTEEKKGYVRVRKSDTWWRLQEMENGEIAIEYEVAAEPGGSVPAWLAKMKVVDIPFKTMTNLRKQLAKQ